MLIAGLAITFISDHSAVIGLVVFLGFAFLISPILLLTIVIVPLTGVSRIMTGIQAMATLIAGAIAAATLTGGLSALILVFSVWAAVTGATELYAGFRSTDRLLAREWLVIGGFTAVLAIVMAVIPLNDVYAVGIFGAYALIVGVFLVIAGVSLRSGDSSAGISVSTEKKSS